MCLLLAAVLGLAACGGGDGDDGDEAGGEQTTTTDAGADSGDEAGSDQELADSLVLVASDLPAGFAETTDDFEDDAEDDPLGRCLGDGAEVLEDNSAKAESRDFEDETGLATSGAAVFRSEDDARQAIEVVRSADLRQCLRDAFVEGVEESAAEEGGEPPDVQVDVGELSFPDVGDEVVAFRAALSFTVAGQEIDFPFDVVFVRSDRSIGFYVFGNLGEPFPTEDAQAAIESALARAA